ncbi:hypothetical protein [Azospirillum palustre]
MRGGHDRRSSSAEPVRSERHRLRGRPAPSIRGGVDVPSRFPLSRLVTAW